jgi:MtrB/PioB family decaheme-associated outer membrane protein
LLAGGLCTAGLPAQELEEEGEQLAPLYTSTIELGAVYTSEDSLKFGEYNGLEDEGIHAIGNIDIRKHSVIGDGVSDYWELSGTNLGVDARTIYGEYSHDGSYGNFGNDSGYSIFFTYDQIPHNQFTGLTPFDGAGTNTQTLPANWVGGGNTAALTNLIPDLKSITVETERQRYGGGISWDINDNWKLKGSYRHEIKEGSDPIGAIFGSSGGNPRSSVISRGIDYDVDEFAASVTYNSGSYQHILSYTLSLFDNNNTALRFDNPFNNPQWAAGSNFSNGAVGQMGYEPDNEAFTINYQTGFNFNPTTRFTANITYGEMTQDDAFLPYSSVQPTVVPLPRDNLDGEIDTLRANVNLFTRYGRNLDLRARYTYDDRDNNTPRDVYLRIPGDSTAQAAIDSSNARVNWPYSMTTHTLDLDGSYRFTPTTKLSVGYTYENKERDFSEVDTTEEHTFNVKLSSAPLDTVSGWLKYAYSTRDGGDNDLDAEFADLVAAATAALGAPDPAAGNFEKYWNNHPILTGHSVEHIEEAIMDFLAAPTNNNLGELFENDPLMRKYYQADRDRNQLSGTINFYPNDVLSWTLTGKYNMDDYVNTQDGLQESNNSSLTLDTSYTPGTNLTTYAYFTYEYFDYQQTGFYHPGFAGALTPWSNRIAQIGNNWWHMDTRDDVYTVGGGLDWEMIEDKFNLKIDYMYSYAITETDVGAEALAFLPYPDITTRIASLTLIGDYKAKENLTLRFKYGFEHFNTTDFGLDSVGVKTLSNVILLGNIAPKYNEHIVGVSLIYGFQQ